MIHAFLPERTRRPAASLAALVALGLTLGGCARFGATPDETANPLIPEPRTSRDLLRRQESDVALPTVREVTQLWLEPRPGGAILRAEALTDGPGAHDVALEIDESGAFDGVLRVGFVAAPPSETQAITTQQRVTAGLWFSDQELAALREIRVIGASNAVSIRP